MCFLSPTGGSSFFLLTHESVSSSHSLFLLQSTLLPSSNSVNIPRKTSVVKYTCLHDSLVTQTSTRGVEKDPFPDLSTISPA